MKRVGNSWIRSAVIVLILFGLLGAVGLNFLDEYYFSSRPRNRDPSTGRVYRHNVKSSRGVAEIYVTWWEQFPNDAVYYIGPLFSIGGFFIAYFLVLQRKKREKEEAER